jgi:hypothetical protein
MRSPGYGRFRGTEHVTSLFAFTQTIVQGAHPLGSCAYLISFCREARNPLTGADPAPLSSMGIISLRPMFVGKRAHEQVFSELKQFATLAAGGAGAATEPCPTRPSDPSKFLIADSSVLAVAARAGPPA